MTIRVNGRETRVEPETLLVDLLRDYRIDDESRGIAVAMNDRVVPRREWALRHIEDGDVVEIIRAVQGG